MRQRFSRRATAAGFTLIEVTVALALGALILAGTWSLVTTIGDATERMSRRAEIAEREAHATQLIRDLVRRVVVDPNAGMVFGGTRDSATFTSSCDSAEGWQEHCTVTLFPVRTPGFKSLRVRIGTALELYMAGSPSIGGLTYLDQRAEPREWRPVWSSTMSPPAVIGAVRARDTLLVVVGQ